MTNTTWREKYRNGQLLWAVVFKDWHYGYVHSWEVIESETWEYISWWVYWEDLPKSQERIEDLEDWIFHLQQQINKAEERGQEKMKEKCLQEIKERQDIYNPDNDRWFGSIYENKSIVELISNLPTYV